MVEGFAAQGPDSPKGKANSDAPTAESPADQLRCNCRLPPLTRGPWGPVGIVYHKSREIEVGFSQPWNRGNRSKITKRRREITRAVAPRMPMSLERVST